jgi:cytoskeletal protein RodZ
MLQRDTRLWASMGMAALSALLALGFISAVRHYGPDRVEAQPTSQGISTAAPAKAAQPNSIVSSRPSTTATSIDPKPSPIATAQPTKQVSVTSPPIVSQKKEAQVATPQKHRVRRNTEEDDYVAKDTYVFYGNSSKPSR